MPWIQALLASLAGYAVLGFLVAAWILSAFAPRRDPALRHTPRHLRLLLLPGMAALWPVYLARHARAERRP